MAKMRALLEADGAQTTEEYLTTEGRDSTVKTVPLMKYAT